jgi:transcriptional regulator with XRE-family HTH domain
MEISTLMAKRGGTEAESTAEALRRSKAELAERRQELVRIQAEQDKLQDAIKRLTRQAAQAEAEAERADNQVEQAELRATAEGLAADLAEAKRLVELAVEAEGLARDAERQARLQVERADLRATAKHLGRAVQVRRAELGLKRPELAKRAGLSYPYTSEIENGAKTPSAKALGQLAEALQVSTADLMARAESAEGSNEVEDPTVPGQAEPDAAPDGIEESHHRLSAGPAWQSLAGPTRTGGHESAELLEAFLAEVQATGDELIASLRNFRELSDPSSRSPAATAGARAPEPSPQGFVAADPAQLQWEEVVAIIVRAEIAAWARTELPNIIRAETERIRSDESRSHK